MGIRRWDFFDEMERFFKEFPFGPFSFRRSTETEGWTPWVDVYETDTEVVVKAEVPGVTREDLELTATEDTVTIKGESKHVTEVEKEGYHRKEIRHGEFRRTIPLPVKVNPENTTAKLNHGILEIRLQKVKEEPKGRKIDIS